MTGLPSRPIDRGAVPTTGVVYVFSESKDHVVGKGFSLDCGTLAAALLFAANRRSGRKSKADFGELSRAVASHTHSKAFGLHNHAAPGGRLPLAKHIRRGWRSRNGAS